MTIPPRYAYGAIAAVAIGAAATLYAVMPPMPPPRTPTLGELATKYLNGRATSQDIDTLARGLTREESAALIAQSESRRAEAATAKTRAEEDMYARVRGGGPEANNSAADVQHFNHELDRMLHGGPSDELMGRCLDAGHSLKYCNQQ